MVESMSSTGGRRARLHVGNVSPSAAADEELHWFFNEAESEVDAPSSFCALLAGVPQDSLESMEDRAEALHSAGKIRTRLESLSVTDARMLESLYRERPWPWRVERVLEVLAGPVEALAVVRVEHLRAIARMQTETKTVTAWLDELLGADRRALAPWRLEAERSCKIAIRAYERARGTGPSVVPTEEG
jgi:hypothetical protein